MTISVIIPVYNRAATVVEAIGSVMAQTARAHEIIVVDDGSTDATLAACRAFGDAITVISQPNGGVSSARNAGIGRASGEWIAFLDSDDVWTPQWLATIAQARDRHPHAGVVVADLTFLGPGYEKNLFAARGFPFGDGPQQLIDHPLPYALSGLSLIATAVRRDWIEAAGGFAPHLRMYEDLDLFTRLASLGPWTFTPYVAAHAHRRDEPAGQALTAIAAKNQVQARRNLVAIYTSLLRNGRLAASEVPAVRKALSAALFGEARAMRDAGQSLWALSPLLGSALRHPAHLTGFGKAALLLLLGNRRYERLTAAQRGFHREDFEA